MQHNCLYIHLTDSDFIVHRVPYQTPKDERMSLENCQEVNIVATRELGVSRDDPVGERAQIMKILCAEF